LVGRESSGGENQIPRTRAKGKHTKKKGKNYGTKKKMELGERLKRNSKHRERRDILNEKKKRKAKGFPGRQKTGPI